MPQQYLSTDPNAGTPLRVKGNGFFGPLERPDGSVSSEISIGVNIDGREMEIPTLVPTLSSREKQWLLTNDISDPRRIPQSIVDKATAHARQRIAAGQSPFADDGYLSTDPNAGHMRAGESLRGLSASQSFFGAHHPTTESGQPLEAGWLDTNLNPMLRHVAQPETLGDVAGLAVPSMVPEFRVPLINMLRQGMNAAKNAPNLRSTPKAVMGSLIDWAFSSTDDLAREAARAREMAPRLAGKAPTLQDTLTEAVNAARQPAKPTSVSLPGGDTVRASGPAPEMNVSTAPSLPVPRPRMGAYSSDATPVSARPPASASGAPPAAAPAAPARSAPAPTSGVRLTAEESQALRQLVAEGYDEADVVQTILQQRGPSAPPSSPAPSSARPPSGKPQLNAAEAKEYQRLLTRGKTPEQAMTIIEQQRAFTASKGLPTSEDTRRAVVDRNATGRWRD